jgi:ABC-type glycerol-3-phosphate transport system substrate-binding protein
MGVSGNDGNIDDSANEIFSSTYYTYKDDNGKHVTVNNLAEVPAGKKYFLSNNFEDAVKGNFHDAAMRTVSLRGITYGIPQTMSFAMMFYRMDVLAELQQEVPQTWDELLALLPVLQTNNMSIGVNYIAAIDFMIYQRGGNMWKYMDNYDYQGAKIGLSEDIALEAFDYVCRLYSDYSFPVSYDAANRFRTGEMPIIIGDYAGIYNTLVVYATEIAGLWEFTSLPGSYRDDDGDGVFNDSFNYDSLAGVGATVMLHGCDDVLGAWQFMQWQTSAEIQSNYGNKMVALIGPSAKYESANLNALQDLSWTASEKEAIWEQMEHLDSIVNYPGSYIINRYTKFAFLAAVNDGADAVDALTGYIDAINAEIKRKREEFNLPTLEADEEPPMTASVGQ